MEAKNLFCYHDGTLAYKLPISLHNYLVDLDLLVNDRVSYVGLIFLNGICYIFLPKAHVIDVLNAKVHARNLVQAFKLYKSDISFIEEDIDMLSSQNENYGLNHITAFLYLIEFYQKKGVYKRRLRQNQLKASGKANWKQTLRKVAPLVNSDASVVYPSVIVSKSYSSEIDEIVQIQKYYTKSADDLIGWLFAPKERNILFQDLAMTPSKPPWSFPRMLSIVKNELARTFNIEKQFLLKNLISLINRDISSQSAYGKYVFGVKFFWPIWEILCKNLLADSSNSFAKQLPAINYFKDGVIFSESKTRQVPDIISFIDDYPILIDAKYYDVTITQPSWYDVIKQVFYQKSLSKVLRKNVDLNGFLLPSGTFEDGPDTVKVCNPSTIESFDIDEFPNLKCYYYPVHIAIEKYLIKNNDLIYFKKIL